ncbi:putative addiction module antidote protein [Rhodopseudomonas julia]|uniref:Addiction module antidote protein n=1 Tax=Rhodopseudomonas julia TaxID=200617 RepID=A0ABU0C4H4_9BRAD|nr:addiction module antidote protein [Rhodopseudomonas julia]MDQ0324575.1 putative addiction module antidote protein [Rhodopseudomonas julia]
MTEVTFSRYDSADYLESEEDIAGYLEAVMDEGGDDPAFVAHALGVVARARNMSQLARDTGISREGLNKALSGEGNPTLDTILKVAKALGLRLSFQPRKAPADKAPRELTTAGEE